MSTFNVDKDLIRDLAQLLQKEGLSEIEIESDNHRLRLARQIEVVHAAIPSAPAKVATMSANVAAAADSDDYANHPSAVRSPMPGTVYRSSEPGAPPFVNVGDVVRTGQTLLVIEAMKTFNEIPAPHAGTVTQIFAENGTPLEYGDVLMLIES